MISSQKKESAIKVTKTASDKQAVKLSRKEWESIGKQAGWIKTAQAEPSQQEQLQAIQQEVPFVNQIIQYVKSGDLQTAKKIAEENGISWANVMQSIQMIQQASSDKMVKTAGIFSWFANMGDKGKKGAAGIALALVMMGLGSNALADTNTNTNTNSQPSIEQSTDGNFNFNNISVDELQNMNAKQLQDVANKAEAGMVQLQVELDQLQSSQDAGENTGRKSDIVAKKISLIDRTLDGYTNFVSSVYDMISSQNSQPQTPTQQVQPQQGLSGGGVEGVL